MTWATIPTPAAPNVPFFAPEQDKPAGTALDIESAPKLFKPIKIRGLEFHNRIFLAPLCQYSAKEGHVQPWHIAHLGGIISRGPGLAMVEASAVLPEGRISPQDVGIWSDDHISGLREIVDYAHGQNQKIAIQIAHAGRKASTVAPWHGVHVANNEVGGWTEDVVGPSELPYNDQHVTPKALTLPQIKNIVQAFADAAKRSVKAGFDVVEIHNAHGYLLHEFISPHSNRRTDDYGGSFENRTRLTLEIVDAVRAVIPDTMPLFLRISASDLLENKPNEPSWKTEDTAKLAHIPADHGVDLLDVSSAGNAKEQDFTGFDKPGYQVKFSEAVKKSVGDKLLVGAVGGISTGTLAKEILEEGKADVIFAGRWFQKDPALVWSWADELGVDLKVAYQMEWPFKSKRKAEILQKLQNGKA